jgi:hypothetical protein
MQVQAPANHWPRLKLYGERNSGTHYVARLVASNLEVRLLEPIEPRRVRRAARYLRASEVVRDIYYYLTFRRNLGWKHMNPRSLSELTRLRIDTTRLRFLMITKNPYAWVVSMLRNPYHLGAKGVGNIDELVQGQWRCTRRENMHRTSASLIEVWCTKTRSYLNLVREGQSCLLRYEDLLADPEASMRRVASALAVPMLNEAFVNVDLSAKREGRVQGRTFESYRRYYLNEDWRTRLTPTAIATINRQLDADLVRQVGYEVLDPAAIS